MSYRGGSTGRSPVDAEIARLDQEWAESQKKYRTYGLFAPRLPSSSTVPSAFLGVGIFLAVAIYAVFKYANGPNALYVILGMVGLALVAGVGLVITMRRNRVYEAAKQEYETRRRELLDRKRRGG